MTKHTLVVPLLLALGLAVVLAGCGGSDPVVTEVAAEVTAADAQAEPQIVWQKPANPADWSEADRMMYRAETDQSWHDGIRSKVATGDPTGPELNLMAVQACVSLTHLASMALEGSQPERARAELVDAYPAGSLPEVEAMLEVVCPSPLSLYLIYLKIDSLTEL